MLALVSMLSHNSSMTLWFVVGTAAELIKIYPLIASAEQRQIKWYVVSTGQNGLNLERQYQDFSLPAEKIIKLNPQAVDLRSGMAAMRWFLRMSLLGPLKFKKIAMQSVGITPTKLDYWIVHGDTFTTLLGAILGKVFRLKTVHIEAGMRSGDIWNPFPEELNRRLVSKLARIHMCPDETAAQDLRDEKTKGSIVVTNGNTVLDSLNTTLDLLAPEGLPTGRYCLANIHRFENLSNDERWSFMVNALVEAAKKHRVILVALPPTEARLTSNPDSKQLLLAAGVEIWPRQTFSRFMHMMHNAEFVISDGGSNQQECYYLGKPCLLLRKVTESREGIGTTCVLSEFKMQKVTQFLANPLAHKGPRILPAKRPTDIIFDFLIAKSRERH